MKKIKKEKQNRGPIFTTHSKHAFQLKSMKSEKDKGLYILILVEPLVIQISLNFFCHLIRKFSISENSIFLTCSKQNPPSNC